MTKSGFESLTASKGDYLKVLYELDAMEDGIHTVDVARKMELSIPSVSRAMKELAEVGYVSKVKYGTIRLTEKGIRAACVIKKRNELLVLFLTRVLDVEQQVAMRDACRLEHALSCETTGKLEEYLKTKANAFGEAGGEMKS
jgi:Mn-dependent DtxR family transcriptional regulator